MINTHPRYTIVCSAGHPYKDIHILKQENYDRSKKETRKL
jgi:hypothetical protein